MARTISYRMALLLAAGLALAACNQQKNQSELETLDNSLAGNAVDPALATALEDQIRVDPKQAQGGAGRPAAPGPKPAAAELGALMSAPAPAAMQPGHKLQGQDVLAQPQCINGLAFAGSWAQRLPVELPVFPRASVSEAAGKDGECRMRAVTFATAADPGQVIDYYYTRATAAGFSAERALDGKEHMLGGKRGSDSAAYYLLARPLPGGGTEVDLIANNGR